MNYARQQDRSLRILAALMASFLLTLSPQSALGQGFKITPLNAPGSNTGTTSPVGLNTAEHVVGSYVDGSGNRVGFLYAAGKYTVITPPTANGFARASGINDSNTIVGDFLTSDGRYHGFLYSGGTYTTYDANTTTSCGIFGINNAGDFVGDVGSGPVQGFIQMVGAKNPIEFYASGTDSTYAYAINSSNEVVGEYFDSSNVQHGFYRSAGGKITEIAYPGAIQTVAYGINDAGEITGTYLNASNLPYGFTYIKGKYASTDFAGTTGINSKGAYVGSYWGVDGAPAAYLASPQAFKLATVKISNDQQAALWGVNKAGVAVGSYVDSSGTEHGMMIAAGKITNIDDPEGVSTICFAINTTNHIVGDYFDTSGNPHGFEYTAGKFTDIPGPSSALSSDASGINDAGVISGDFFSGTDRTHHGFVLKGGKYKQLDVPGATTTFGGGINAAGLVTLIWGDAVGYTQSSLYNGKKYTSINVPGAALTVAQAINTAGDIVFFVLDPYGVEHAALKKGNDYFIFDDPKGFNTGAGGINDSDLIVGFYTPTGQSVPQPFKGTE